MDAEVTLTSLLEVSAEARRFRKDFESLFWFTYRRNFPPFASSSLSTDMGWGCMIRSGQMLLCNALLTFLTTHCELSEDMKDQKSLGRCVLEWFLDYPGPSYPFSIHNIIAAGNYFQVKPGDWLGPSTICHILKYVPFALPFVTLTGLLKAPREETSTVWVKYVRSKGYYGVQSSCVESVYASSSFRAFFRRSGIRSYLTIQTHSHRHSLSAGNGHY
jgi:hypothetical protein